MTKHAEHGNINTLQASNPLWVKPGWGELTPVYYCCVWPLTSLTCIRPRCPPSYQTANRPCVSAGMAVDWCSWCLTLRLPDSCGSFSRNTGMQMRQGGEAKNSIHSFFLFTACRRGEGGVFFFLCCCSLQVNGGRFNINSLGLVSNQCSLTFVTFSGVILPSSCLTFMSISQNTRVRNKSYYEMVEWSKQMLKWREKLLTRCRFEPGGWSLTRSSPPMGVFPGAEVFSLQMGNF